MSDDPILAALSRLEAGQTHMEAELTCLATGQTHMEAELTRLATGQTHMEAELTRLATGQTHMEAELTRLATGQDMVRAEAADFREQVLNRLTAIREDIGVNMARVDRVAETVTDLRAELVSLRGENAALWRMIKAIESRVDQIESR
jgi:cell division protein FtsB